METFLIIRHCHDRDDIDHREPVTGGRHRIKYRKLMPPRESAHRRADNARSDTKPAAAAALTHVNSSELSIRIICLHSNISFSARLAADYGVSRRRWGAPARRRQRRMGRRLCGGNDPVLFFDAFICLRMPI
ncbi:hypothetical protein EVAR_31182_1 [Eumeta japonica]|uniref:Uncharacterized protein n=1 Tax=Eumeta variegata TaxID=151549 RepID=A0A4C1VVV4_EUMVA|nr:hypothetical protein EVAR_31182_1 [Eumeta japonica]